MSATYTFDDLTGAPCVPYIYNRIFLAAFADLAIEEATWQDEVLSITWMRALTPTEIATLRGFAVDSVGKRQVIVESIDIVAQIFWAAMGVGGMPLILKMCDAFDKVPSSRMCLDNYNYPLARMRVQKMADDGYLTQAEVDLMLSKIPESEYV